MGNLGIISLLCSRGANVDATKTTGSTPLHTAADVNQTAAVRLLLSAPCNADPHALMSGDTTPLYLAAQVWSAPVQSTCAMRHSLAPPLTPTNSAAGLRLSKSCCSTCTPTVFSFPCPRVLCTSMCKRWTKPMLLVGARTPHASPAPPRSTNSLTTQVCTASGFYSPRNTEVGNGATALHAAVENGHLATVDALLAGGAKQATTMQGVSPLLLAIQ